MTPEQSSTLQPDTSGRRVLVVAYYFPPMGLSGVHRIAKFTRHLTAFGWKPTVLTVGNAGYYAYDYSLLEDVLEAGVTIERTSSLDPFTVVGKGGRRRVALPTQRRKRIISGITQTFLQPDNKIGWKRHAVRRGVELHQHEPFDVIYATAPPFTSFLIARELQARTGLPMVLDYRDPWLDSSEYFYATPFHRRYAARLEESVLKYAESITVVNRRIKEQLIARYPFLNHEEIHILPTGYDPHDFSVARRFPLPRSGKMRVTYCGVLDNARSPRPFFAAVARIFAERPELRDRIELQFVGLLQEAYRAMAGEMGIASSITSTGYLEHQEALRHMLAADILWFPALDSATTPGKMQDYMGARKPILALAPEGPVRRMLNSYGAARSVGPDSVEEIASALLDFYELWSRNSLPAPNEEVVREYDQRVLVERLSNILSHAVRIV